MDDSPRPSRRVQSVGGGFDALRHHFRRGTSVNESIALSKIKEVSSHEEPKNLSPVVMVVPPSKSLDQVEIDSNGLQLQMESTASQKTHVEPG